MFKLTSILHIKTKNTTPSPLKTVNRHTEPQVTIRADVTQIERLAQLGAVTPEQAAAGLQAGGMLVKVPARLVAEFQAAHPNQTKAEGSKVVAPDPEIEELALRIEQAGLSGPARLLLVGGRPVSFVGSQFLLLLQPLAQIGFGEQNRLGRYSRLLENRANLDSLLARLEKLEAARQATS